MIPIPVNLPKKKPGLNVLVHGKFNRLASGSCSGLRNGTIIASGQRKD